MKNSIGVIVGRFQVPTLHEGHRTLIRDVGRENKLVCVVLGVPATLGTKRDPLDFVTRGAMIREAFPTAIIRPIEDQGDDWIWSEKLDALLKSEFPKASIRLYGGRDSFIPRYHGQFKTKAVKKVKHISGSDIRKIVGAAGGVTAGFRSGVIYSTQNQFPRVFMTVDVAVIRYGGSVLMGRKYKASGLMFPGGFVDPKDRSLEEAAERELLEETGLKPFGKLAYMGSFRQKDWRYEGTGDCITTAFFSGEYGSIEPKASDDLVSVQWVPMLKKTRNDIYESHRNLFDRLLHLRGIK